VAADKSPRTGSEVGEAVAWMDPEDAYRLENDPSTEEHGVTVWPTKSEYHTVAVYLRPSSDPARGILRRLIQAYETEPYPQAGGDPIGELVSEARKILTPPTQSDSRDECSCVEWDSWDEEADTLAPRTYDDPDCPVHGTPTGSNEAGDPLPTPHDRD
jgi:hypothetical protein